MKIMTLCLWLGIAVGCGAPREPAAAGRAPTSPSGGAARTERPAIAELRSLWPAAMKTIEAAAPVVDVSAWQPGPVPLEAALFLPESAECSPLIIGQPDAEGVACRVVTRFDEREGRRYRVSVDCTLHPELVVDYGHLRDEVLVGGKWEATEEGMAVSAPAKTYGVLTTSTVAQLTYAGESVTPVEGCVGERLEHCSGVSLPAWMECRACDKTELFFIPGAKEDPPSLQHWPECLSRCPAPPHQARIKSLGDLGLWRRRTDEAAAPRVFRDPAACQAYLAQQRRPPTTTERSE